MKPREGEEIHPMTRYHVALIALALTAPGIMTAQDEVRLQTGATFTGTILQEDEDAVTLQVDGGTMTFGRSQIASIKVAKDPEQAARKRAMLTLSRFPDHDSWHFLYRDGKRVGYRTLTHRREEHAGVPGYVLLDRLVFMDRPGAQPDVDLHVREFVDAELNPLHFECRVTSGPSSRILRGTREGHSLVIEERIGGRLLERTALFRPEVAFPRSLLRQLASRPPPEGAYPDFRVFLPKEGTFARLGLERHMERITLRGQIRDVLVFRLRHGGRDLETWLDTSGNVMREEIGSPHLVSLLAPREEVMGFALGEDTPESADIGLELISEATGFRLLRPDLSWEIGPVTKRGSVISLLRPAWRATVDVIEVAGLDGATTEEGVLLHLIERMQEGATDFKVEGPYPARVGDRSGLRFEVTCYRRGSRIQTMGAVLLDGRGRAFLILGACSDLHGKLARPAFIELFDSIRLLDPPAATLSPFDRAEATLGG